MTRLLTLLIGRLPIGWLQLSHNKTRMAAALAGVAFANVLVFVQLGILGALNGTIATTYNPLDADILVSANDANTFSDGSPIPRRYMYRSMSIPGVEAAAPLYIGKVDWTRADGSSASLQVYGLPPEALRFVSAELAEPFQLLKLQDAVLMDTGTRGIEPGELDGISPRTPMRFEIKGHTLNAVGTFSIGGGFNADGNMIVSDQTFLRLFPQRLSGTPSHILIKTVSGEDAETVSDRLRSQLTSAPVKIRPLDKAIAEDVRYQTTERPIGVIFGFGVFIGILVGIVIVYQVLTSDVADHIREYATFKAIGYEHRFFLGIITEEAVILAVLGFVPGVFLSSVIYAAMASATDLPVAMDTGRAFVVFAGTLLTCTLSGFIATRRLAAADPADLF